MIRIASNPAFRLSGFPAFLMAGMIAAFGGLAGCGAVEDPSASSKSADLGDEVGQSPLGIDAGIIFLGTETYQCFPLERFHLTSPEQIASIETSCECLSAQIVQYVDGSGIARPGLKISFLDDSEELPRQGFSMAGRITIYLEDLSTRELTVNFLHTFAPKRGGAL